VLHHDQGSGPNLGVEVVALAFAELQVLFGILIKIMKSFT